MGRIDLVGAVMSDVAHRVGSDQDVMDSRDIIERIAELEALETRDEDEAYELYALKRLEEEASGFGDWEYGGTLIRDSYFEAYARELAEDIGAISGEEGWPLGCIDWERAADQLRQDYTSIEFNGVTYWVRS